MGVWVIPTFGVTSNGDRRACQQFYVDMYAFSFLGETPRGGLLGRPQRPLF